MKTLILVIVRVIIINNYYLALLRSKKEESAKKRPSSRGIRTADSPMLLVWGDDVTAAPDPTPGYDREFFCITVRGSTLNMPTLLSNKNIQM